MVNIEKIEADIDARMAEERAKKIERIVKSLEAIQNDVVLVMAFNQILQRRPAPHIDLCIAANKAVGVRVVDIIDRDRKNENENSAVSEYINLDIELKLASLATVSGGDISKH